MKHKYKIGDLILYRAYEGSLDLTNKKIIGVINDYDGRYYLVHWSAPVPVYYTGVLSEIEINAMRENLMQEIKNEN